MSLSYRENFIRTVRFQNPEYLIADVHINSAMWAYYKRDLEKVVLKHPSIFPNYVPGSIDFDNMHFSFDMNDDNYKLDEWSCKWHYPLRYLAGVVVEHPLLDMENFDTFPLPQNPVPQLSEQEWAKEIQDVQSAKLRGELTRGDTEHGFLFLRHTYLRGFENAMEDYALYPENVDKIYDMILTHNQKLVDFHIRRGTDLMYFAEDLGTQTSTIISGDMFRRFVKPAYAKLMQPCKQAGMMVGLHSDGKTLDILEDQIEAGVDIVNPQDLCNGIDELQKRIKGRACIQLDIDRQTVVPFGTAKDIDDLIREEIEKLGSPQGGLMLVCGLYPPTPPENVDALATAIEKYRGMWF